MNPHGHGFLPFTGGWWLSLAIFCAMIFAATFMLGAWGERRRQRDSSVRKANHD